MCTLYKNKPYGLASIKYIHPEDVHDLSFEGFGVFTEGELHMGPFTCVDETGFTWSFTHMLHGRPADGGCFLTYFNGKDRLRFVNSQQQHTNMGRFQLLTSRVQSAALPHGHGKMWLEHARIFVGEFHMNNLKKGDLYEL
jgi:hypothetical protein